MYTRHLLSILIGAAVSVAAQADMSQARQLFADGKYVEAQTMLKPLYKDKASKGEAAMLLGQIALKQNATAEAVDYLEDAAEALPNDAKAQFLFAQSSCMRATEVSMLRAMSFAGDCREGAEKALKLEPKLWDARELLIDFYLQAPGIAGGGRDKADALLKDTRALDAEHADVLEIKLAAHDKQWDKAMKMASDLADNHPDKADHRMLAGLLFTQQEKYSEALQQFRLMAEKFPQDARAPYQIGRVAVLSKNAQWYDEGEKAFQKFFQMPHDDKAPQPAWAWFRLGELYELMARAEDAKSAFASARKNSPDERLQGELKKKKA